MRQRGVYKRGRVWWISYYDASGKRHFERGGRSYQEAAQLREQRIAEVRRGTLALATKRIPTFVEFVETWRREIALGLKPSTRRGYETALKHHLLPRFGSWPINRINRAAARAFIAEKAKEQRWSYSRERPNPDRPTLSRKTIQNLVALLSAILEAAAVDYELLPTNPLRGILRRRNMPTAAFAPREPRVRVLEPEDFHRAVDLLPERPRRMVLTAALAGLRWGEQVGLKVEDVDLRRNRLRITRALYRRVPQTPKTEQSVRDVVMSPLVRQIVQAVPWREGYIFSPDGVTPIGEGSWLRRRWTAAQKAAGSRTPIGWHDLRHQAASFWIALGKSPKWIAQQLGHASAGFTLDRYGHLFESVETVAGEWPEDLMPGLATVTETVTITEGQRGTERVPARPGRGRGGHIGGH